MTGYELASHLREKTWADKALFVAVSGYAKNDQEQTVKACCDHYLVKPADLKQLSEILESV